MWNARSRVSRILFAAAALSFCLPRPAAPALIAIDTGNDQDLGGIVVVVGDRRELQIGETLVQPFAVHAKNPDGSVNDNHFVKGEVRATNFDGTLFTLVLTEFEYRTDITRPVLGVGVTISIAQTYEMDDELGFGIATHQIAGEAKFSKHPQAARLEKTSNHDGVPLDPLLVIAESLPPPAGLPQTRPLAAGPKGEIFIADDPYSIVTSYHFLLEGFERNPIVMSITLPDSGIDIGRISTFPASEPASVMLIGIGAVAQFAYAVRSRHRRRGHTNG
jgi:hypothetical protein